MHGHGPRLLLGIDEVEDERLDVAIEDQADNFRVLLTTGLPELPPMMSAVHTKLNGVLKSILSFRSTHRGGRSNGDLSWCSRLRS